MYIQQLYTKCLSEAAYYIENDGEAAIIDPLRDIDDYIKLASSRNARIKYIFETHFHADFVSGHIDLSKETGAPIVFGPNAKTKYKVHNATDGEVFKLGSISIELIHTPGHTLESSCYILKDRNNKPYAIFTGDTLFVGDVGRPDLSSGGFSSEEMAGIMYDTLRNKIIPLPNDVIVYPAHGPGSSCGKNMGPETFSTIGKEKENNYALQDQTKEEFIKSVTNGLLDAPKYFALNAKLNMEGYNELKTIKSQGLTPLSIKDFKKAIEEDVVILDTRDVQKFTHGFIPKSIFIGLDGRFAEWAAMILPFDKRIIMVTEAGKEEETLIRLTRVGFDKIVGYLKGGFEEWKNNGEKLDMIVDVEADELLMDIPFDPNLTILDVRKETEFASGHLQNALNIPVEQLTDITIVAQFEDDQNLYIHCAGGYRSVIAASLLKKEGINNLRNVLGGWAKIKEEEKVKIVKEPSVLN